MFKDPITNDPITKDPITKDPITKDPITKDPITKDPITKDHWAGSYRCWLKQTRRILPASVYPFVTRILLNY
jgi:hypothetical protein